MNQPQRSPVGNGERVSDCASFRPVASPEGNSLCHLLFANGMRAGLHALHCRQPLPDVCPNVPLIPLPRAKALASWSVSNPIHAVRVRVQQDGAGVVSRACVPSTCGMSPSASGSSSQTCSRSHPAVGGVVVVTPTLSPPLTCTSNSFNVLTYGRGTVKYTKPTF